MSRNPWRKRRRKIGGPGCPCCNPKPRYQQIKDRPVTQMGEECRSYKAEAAGSMPAGPTDEKDEGGVPDGGL